MEKYQKYYGVIIFLVVAFLSVLISCKSIAPMIENSKDSNTKLEQTQTKLKNKQEEEKRVQKKIKQLKDAVVGSPKKIYAPSESDLGSETNDTLFFTLYNDLIEMIHQNSVKIKAIDYSYNPKKDKFVEFGKSAYFVCNVKLEIVSNYVNLGKFIQDIYQYPYYIRINEIKINPYEKDKKILVTNLSLNLYAHTTPQEDAKSTGGAAALDIE